MLRLAINKSHFSMSGITYVLSDLSHLILTIVLQGRPCYPHFIADKTETEEVEISQDF